MTFSPVRIKRAKTGQKGQKHTKFDNTKKNRRSAFGGRGAWERKKRLENSSGRKQGC